MPVILSNKADRDTGVVHILYLAGNGWWPLCQPDIIAPVGRVDLHEGLTTAPTCIECVVGLTREEC